uniref:RNA polymerase sigma factor n=1 Tax=Ornithobacterium rhinotracheale TaxID=28251 RepID=UPI001C87CF25|nr:sigma factor [Ornithobacterium rhinotracheale]
MECKDDLFLLQEIKLGNEKAFKILFTKYRPRLTNYAYRFVNNQTVVEDLVQETFEKKLGKTPYFIISFRFLVALYDYQK